MTKEMEPSQWVDILTDAILYYCQRGLDNIGMQLNSWKKWQNSEYMYLSHS